MTWEKFALEGRRRWGSYYCEVRSVDANLASASLWNVAVPSWPGRLTGLTMAGFSDLATDFVEVAVVPHPAVMVIVDLGDRPIVVDDGSGRQHRDSVVAGLSPNGARVRGGQTFECLQVRLSPILAHRVLDAASEICGMVVALEDLWGSDALRIQEKLRAAESWDDRFVIAETALVQKYDAGRAVDAEVAFVWSQIVASRGLMRVERLAAEVGWSRKRLWSRFRSQIGLTPKRASQLIRFDYAAHGLASGQSAASVAVESGYVDQSHLHRDVMVFAGTTPTVVAAAPFLAIDDVAWATSKSPTGT